MWARVLVCLSLVCLLGLASMGAQPRSNASPVQSLLVEKAAQAPAEPVTVIAQVEGPSLDTLVRAVTDSGGKVTARWDFIHALAARLPAARAVSLGNLPGIKYISWDAPVLQQNITSVNPSAVQTAYPFAIGADKVWAAGNYGANVVVATVDSGLAPFPGVDQDFGTRFFRTNVNPAALTGNDPYGHGTFVGGFIAGDGTLSNQAYVGVAPQSFLVSVRVSNDQGQASTANLVDGLNWIYNNYKLKNIRVVNISMQSSVQLSYLLDPVDAAVEQLWNAGLVVVVSAGNNGGQICSMCYSPANDPFVITVGAFDDQGLPSPGQGVLTTWTSLGTTQDGFVKPDLFAPGAHLWSTLSADNSANPILAQQFPANVSADRHYIKLGGTSAAAPVVSGAVALLLHAHPLWTPNQVKWVLMNTTGTFLNQGSLNGALRIDSAIAYAGLPLAANVGLLPSTASTSTSGTSGSTVQWSTVQWSTSGDY